MRQQYHDGIGALENEHAGARFFCVPAWCAATTDLPEWDWSITEKAEQQPHRVCCNYRFAGVGLERGVELPLSAGEPGCNYRFAGVGLEHDQGNPWERKVWGCNYRFAGVGLEQPASVVQVIVPHVLQLQICRSGIGAVVLSPKRNEALSAATTDLPEWDWSAGARLQLQI